MDVIDIQEKANQEALVDVSFYNPLTEDFYCKYNGKEYCIPGLKISTYKKPLADHIKTHLAVAYGNKKGWAKNPQKTIEEAYKQMEFDES